MDVSSCKAFLFYDSVYPFSYSIVRRIVVLCHADGGIEGNKPVDICSAAVLDTAV